MSTIPQILLRAGALALIPALAGAELGPNFATMAGADLVVQADIAGMNANALYQEIEAKNNQRDEALEQKMLEVTGLGRKDMTGVCLAADLDQIELTPGANPADQMDKVHAVLQVNLAKAVSRDQMKNGILTLANQHGEAVTAEDGPDGLVKFNPANDQPAYYAGLSQSGKTVLMSPKSEHALAAIQRANGNQAEAAPAGLANALNSKGHFVGGLLIPAAAQAAMKQQVAAMQQAGASGGDPGAAMMVGMFAPMANLQALIFNGAFSENDLAIKVAADLGDANSAAQASGTLNMMLGMMAAQMGDAGKMLKLSNQDKILRLNVNIPKEQLLQGPAGMLPGPGGDEDGPGGF